MKKFSTLLLAASVAFGAQAVCAADSELHGDVQLSRIVDYSDLNLDRSAGVTTLYQRLERAAKTVCAPLEGRGLKSTQQNRQCRSEAMARAVSDVNQPLLTQLHRDKSGQSETAVVASR